MNPFEKYYPPPTITLYSLLQVAILGGLIMTTSNTYKFYLNGEWRESSSGQTIDIPSPYLHEVISQVQAIANKIETGSVQINGRTERGPDHFPFIGVKRFRYGRTRYSQEP